MRQCTLWGTGLTWSAEWGHTAVVMPSPTLPCQENPWLYYTWPSLKTSLITFRLEAIAAGCCNGLSHFTSPRRIVKHLGFTILFFHLADKWIIAVWKTIPRPLNCIALWEQALQCRLPFLAIYSEENVVLTTLQFENIPWCEIVQRFPQLCSSLSEIVRNSKRLSAAAIWLRTLRMGLYLEEQCKICLRDLCLRVCGFFS